MPHRTMHIHTGLAGCGLAAALLLVTTAASAGDALVPPPGFMRAAPKAIAGGTACKPAPAPLTGALTLPNRYADDPDGGADDVNIEARSAKRKMLRPAIQLEDGLRREVDLLFAGKSGNVACVLDWMVKWSEARALLDAGSDVGYLTARNWTVAALGATWLRLKFSSSRPLEGKDEAVHKVDAWFRALSDEIMRAFGGRKQGKDFNNHVYWASWAVMSTGVILNDCARFDWAMRNFTIAMRQVQPDGVLRNELQRRKMALNYHNFSVQPLSMIAAFAVANGRPLSTDEGDALQRLAQLVMEGLNDPKVFETKANAPQIHPGSADRFVFLEPYCWAQECPAAWREQLVGLRPVEEIRLGGDLSAIFADAPRGSAGKRVACGNP